MEIEVKLRLPDSTEHQKVLTVLSPFHTHTHHQLNTFFDGADGELSSRLAIVRLRFYENSQHPKCFICLKAKVEKDEKEVDPATGYVCMKEPTTLGDANSRVLKRVGDEFSANEFVGLGVFRNVRNLYAWNGMNLEVDKTIFEFGTCYEIECESPEPKKGKAVIEGLLKENGIGYSYAERSKFAIFRAGKLPR